MYFFEALKNYGKLRDAFEASKDAALAYRKLEREIQNHPKHAIVIGGDYVLVSKSMYLLLAEKKNTASLTWKDAADSLVQMFRECLVNGIDMDSVDVRALTMAIGALSTADKISTDEVLYPGVDVSELEREAAALGDDWPETDGENEYPESEPEVIPDIQDDSTDKEDPNPGRIEFVKA